ncbi:uncharacterized protein LOC105071405 isoform X4 [Camelus bactrianus]|uniref:Uncharacterized protein LOC105071405 isoform X4 n=2 Tax=Camelus bactrianus TaxID=9837 RepID=A0AC58PF18_CAMBA
MKNYLHCSKCPTSVRKNHEKSTCPITFGKNGHSLDMKAADEKLFLQARSFLRWNGDSYATCHQAKACILLSGNHF